MGARYADEQPDGFVNQIKKVAIIGAGGSIGQHITRHLIQTAKHAVTIVTRPDSANKPPEDPSVTVKSVDFGDESALAQALEGHQALIITMSVRAPRDTVIKAARAAHKAGVRYVFPNWYGHDPANQPICDDSFLTPMRDSLQAEFATYGGTTSYVFLACNFWYEFSLGGGADRFGFDFPKRSLVLYDGGKVVIPTTTWPQCCRAIGNLLSLQDLPKNKTDTTKPVLSQFANSTVYISSFHVSQLDMYESVKRVTGTTDADWTITHASAKERWEKGANEVRKGNFGVFTEMMYSRMFVKGSDGYSDGDFQSRRELHNDFLSLPVEELDEATAVGVRMGENGEVNRSH